jgi:hypothetical protein
MNARDGEMDGGFDSPGPVSLTPLIRSRHRIARRVHATTFTRIA